MFNALVRQIEAEAARLGKGNALGGRFFAPVFRPGRSRSTLAGRLGGGDSGGEAGGESVDQEWRLVSPSAMSARAAMRRAAGNDRAATGAMSSAIFLFPIW